MAADPELRELLVSVLSTVKRVERELDLAHRARRQLQLRRPHRHRPLPLRPHAARQRPDIFPESGPEAETVRMPVVERPADDDE